MRVLRIILMAMMFISLHTQAEGYRNSVHRDIKEVVKRYRLAAENGSESAQIKLSYLYYKGEDVPQNYKESTKWCRLAAEQGNTLAQSLLGEIYGQHGDGASFFSKNSIGLRPYEFYEFRGN